MIKTAHLRTYLPADRVGALPPMREDRSLEGRTFDDGVFMWTGSMADDAMFTEWEGEQYACPRNMRLRMIEGALAFTKTFPALHVLTDTERRDFADELAIIRRDSLTARSFVLSSPWHVPLRWFSAFSPIEREVYQREAGTSVRYRTSIGEAVDRVHWASTVLTASGFAEQIVQQVDDLERWLIEFSADSMVELDYADAADLFSDADIAMDESANDVRSSLLALEQGDGEKSRRSYEAVATRWMRAQSHTFSN